MSLEELRPNYEAIANERLDAIHLSSNRELRTAIAALRALGGQPRSEEGGIEMGNRTSCLGRSSSAE